MTQNKRRRTDSPSPIPSQNDSDVTAEPYERSEDFYFDDGSIVLVAEKTAFRVHRGQVARHSPVFRDMFGIIKQPTGAEQFDGCSVVRLTDRSVDVKRLLSALYDIKPLALEDFNVLCGVLRMAHKYIIDDLRHHSRNALGLAYPTSLAQWDNYAGKRPPARHVIHVARKTGADILLPSAFYRIACTMPSAEVFALEPSMTTLDLSTLYRGKETILSLLPEFLLSQIHTSECDDEECAEEWKKPLERLQGEMLEPAYFQTPDPLEMLLEYWRFVDQTPKLCRGCKEHARKESSSRRAKIWEDLPEIFGFPCWDDLANK